MRPALRRRFRRFGSLPSIMCRFQPLRRLSLPEAVILTRFLAARLVFIFGISSPVNGGPDMAPIPPHARDAPAEPWRPSIESVLGFRAQHDVQHPAFHARVVLGDRD